MDKFVKVDILKHSGEDCSNHGVTSRVNETLLFAEGISDNEIRRICEEEGVDYKNALQIKTEKFTKMTMEQLSTEFQLILCGNHRFCRWEMFIIEKL